MANSIASPRLLKRFKNEMLDLTSGGQSSLPPSTTHIIVTLCYNLNKKLPCSWLLGLFVSHKVRLSIGDYQKGLKLNMQIAHWQKKNQIDVEVRRSKVNDCHAIGFYVKLCGHVLSSNVRPKLINLQVLKSMPSKKEA